MVQNWSGNSADNHSDLIIIILKVRTKSGKRSPNCVSIIRWFYIAELKKGCKLKPATNKMQKLMSLIRHPFVLWVQDLNKQQIQQPLMKSELERILSSDLSEYKIAVSDHIRNLDHFQQCLTERSVLMQKLNQVLMQEIERCHQDPPTQFDAIQLPQPPKQTKLGLSNCMEFPFSSQSCSISQVLKTQRKTDHLMDICSKFQIDLKLLRRLINETKKSITNKTEETRKLLTREITSSISYVVQKTKQIYETKIRHLELTIDELRKQNEEMKIKENSWMQKVYHPSREQRLNSCQNQEASSNRKQNYQIYSPIQSYGNVNSPQHALDEQTELLTQRDMYYNVDPQPRMSEPDKKVGEMTINNNNEVSWKHFLCDIQNTTLKQIKQVFKPRMGKQNLITEIGPTSSFFFNQQAQKSINEPGFPVLLKKAFSDKAYDIPVIRALLVSYPPIEQGFATLKLGNEVVYRGMWKFRKFHGKGKLCLPEYSYEGDFEHGLFHGRGTLKIGSLEYVGEFVQNKAEGEGTVKMGSKNISGRWKNNSLWSKY